MKVLTVDQGTQEWLDLRARFGFRTSSNAPAMMGVGNKHQTRDQLLRAITLGDERECSSYQENVLFPNAHRYEKQGIARYSAESGEDFMPVVGCDDEEYLMASFDGLSIDWEIAVEHKQWSKALAEMVANYNDGIGELDPLYTVQMDHQMAVSGARACAFIISDDDHYDGCVYYRDDDKISALLHGWRQLDTELAEYKPRALKGAVETEVIESLPALVVQVAGGITNTNAKEYAARARQFIKAINTDLKTDEDFANAESAAKFCGEAEKRIKRVKDDAISQTASIEEVFSLLDSIQEELRRKRLALEKLVKERKLEIRQEIAMAAQTKLADLVLAFETELDMRLSDAVRTAPFADAMRNKKTVQSLHDSVDSMLARAMVAARVDYEKRKANIAGAEEALEKFKFLFRDLHAIAVLPAEQFKALVSTRIQEHEAAEKARIEAEVQRKLEEARLQEEASILAKQLREQREAEQKAAIEKADADDPAKLVQSADVVGTVRIVTTADTQGATVPGIGTRASLSTVSFMLNGANVVVSDDEAQSIAYDILRQLASKYEIFIPAREAMKGCL